MTSVLSTVKNNNPRILKMLIAVPASVKPQDVRQGLLYACREGYVDCLRCLLEANVDPEMTDTSGNTLLHLAVMSGHAEVVTELIKTKLDVNCKGSGGCRPVHVAAKYVQEQCLEVLLAAGAKLNVVDSAQNTPLITAMKHGHYGVIKILIRWGCDVNLKDNNGRTALHYGCHKAQCVDILLTAGADPDLLDNDGNSPGMLAAAEGFTGVIRRLITANCDVNLAKPSSKRTILHTVAMKGHADCIQDLVMAGADMNLYDNDFRTPLWYAINYCRLEVVKFLLRANSEVDTYQCPRGIPTEACPVRLTLERKLVDILKLFILTGFDADHMRSCLEEADLKAALAEREDFSRWLDHAQGPLTLKQICRKWIRHHQGRLLFHDLSLLHIPEPLKDFLSLKELDDEH